MRNEGRQQCVVATDGIIIISTDGQGQIGSSSAASDLPMAGAQFVEASDSATEWSQPVNGNAGGGVIRSCAPLCGEWPHWSNAITDCTWAESREGFVSNVQQIGVLAAACNLAPSGNSVQPYLGTSTSVDDSEGPVSSHNNIPCPNCTGGTSLSMAWALGVQACAPNNSPVDIDHGGVNTFMDATAQDLQVIVCNNWSGVVACYPGIGSMTQSSNIMAMLGPVNVSGFQSVVMLMSCDSGVPVMESGVYDPMGSLWTQGVVADTGVPESVLSVSLESAPVNGPEVFRSLAWLTVLCMVRCLARWMCVGGWIVS